MLIHADRYTRLRQYCGGSPTLLLAPGLFLAEYRGLRLLGRGIAPCHAAVAETALSSPPGLPTLDGARPRRQRRVSQGPLRVAGSERRSLNLKLRAHEAAGAPPGRYPARPWEATHAASARCRAGAAVPANGCHCDDRRHFKFKESAGSWDPDGGIQYGCSPNMDPSVPPLHDPSKHRQQAGPLAVCRPGPSSCIQGKFPR